MDRYGPQIGEGVREGLSPEGSLKKRGMDLPSISLFFTNRQKKFDKP
jgi:hypothetical protein